MHRTRTPFACAVVAAGLFTFAAPAPAAAPVTEPIGGEIQFQAVLLPNLSPIKDPSCPYIGVNVGAGIVPPFGSVTFTSSECVVPNGLNPANLDASKGRMVLTTTGGDMVNGTYGGTFLLSADGQSYTASAMPFSIVGGTGAYVRARGNGSLQIIQSVTTGIGKINPSGTVSY